MRQRTGEKDHSPNSSSSVSVSAARGGLMPLHGTEAASLEAQRGRDVQVAFILPCMTFYK